MAGHVILSLGLLISLFTINCGSSARPESASTLVPALTSTPTLEANLETPPTVPTPGSTPLYAIERYNGEAFESADDWAQRVSEWELREPNSGGFIATLAGLFERLIARRVGRQTSGRLNSDEDILNDKWKHCVLGGEIAQVTSLSTAEYAAWFKEYQDLTDGVAGTNFEEDDYEAAMDGARQSTQGQCDDCLKLCEERWGDRHESWDGTRPSSDRNLLPKPTSGFSYTEPSTVGKLGAAVFPSVAQGVQNSE